MVSVADSDVCALKQNEDGRKVAWSKAEICLHSFLDVNIMHPHNEQQVDRLPN
jgi:hypothetical protein